jgi:phage terminase large subunit
MNAEFPAKLEFLFEPHRYKVAYGGRGGTKSWAFARALLILGAASKLHIVCARETKKSIDDSVHKLLSDQIELLGLSEFYDIQKHNILGANDTDFIFVGLKHNVQNIKSLEAADILWIEEAQTVSKSSWQVVVPTVRKPGSEIWVSYNPELETDATHKMFVVNEPPPGAKVVYLTYKDNPWFPEVLRVEMEHLKATDQAAYEHVWEGSCRSAIEGAVYAEEMKQAEAEGRITRVSCDRTKPVDTFWDLGFGDDTAIWFAQATVDGEYRLIDYMENHGKTLEWYLIQMQTKGYLYGVDWIPWDGLKPQRLGSGRAIEELMRAAGRNVRMVTMLEVYEGINAARTVFSQCRFDAEKCADGLQGLRHYQWGPPNANGEARRLPLHNWASHPADAFRYFATAIQAPSREIEQYRAARRNMSYGSEGWMAG